MLQGLTGSVVSHDYEYHIRKNHKLLCIGVFDRASALWAATRFKQLHQLHVWEEMCNKCGANTIEEYAQMYIDYSNMIVENEQNRLIDLRTIINGSLIETLKTLGFKINATAVELYDIWLTTK